MVKKQYLVGLGAFIALLCLMVVLYMVSKQGGIPLPSPSGNYTQHVSQSTQTTEGSETVPIQVTDPSFLPRGTSALWIAFSNASVYVQGSGWASGGGYGPVNLAAQTNQSVTVSSVEVPYNAVINETRLGIGSASIMINGTQYNLSIAGGYVFANFSKANLQSGDALLVDLSPFILPAQNSAGTARMEYSAKGYLLNGTGGSYVGQFGHVAVVGKRQAAQSANISIENATLSANGTVTTLRMTVVDNSNIGVRIRDVAILGPEILNQNSSAISDLSGSYADAIVQKYSGSVQASGSSNSSLGSILIGSFFNATASGVSSSVSSGFYSKALGFGTNLSSIVYNNVSALARLAGPLPRSVIDEAGKVNATLLRTSAYKNIYSGLMNASLYGSRLQSNIDSVGFSVGEGGSLYQSWGQNGGYYLQPGSSVTLNYTGELELDNTTTVSLLPSSSYRIVIIGDNGADATYLLNSTG